jgi:NADPH2:quinone reductase
MKAIRVHEAGGPEKLVYEETPVPTPGPGQARIKIQAIGLNYIDVYFRTGLYKTSLPFTPGMEAAGTVDAVSDGVTGVAPGDRVAYAMNLGAYGEYALANAWQLVKLPGEIDFETGAAAMLQGMTAHYLAYSTFPLQAGQVALVHAAAGGVGLLLIQVARMKGARVIGTASTDEKARLAREAGADHVIRYDQTDFEAEIKKIVGNQGIDVVYDSVGQATFEKSLNCLKKRGMMVLYGQSSGPVPPVDLNILNAKGSIFVTRPSLAHHASTPVEIGWRTGDLFRWVTEGNLKLRIGHTFSLRDAAKAHQALEGRQTTGKILLIP